jgi:16S rRNA (guanine966-N2)-methyltransferase
MSRITAGTAKGFQLKVLGGTTRPLTDRIKISLFDTLSPVLENSTVLDLYSGSGAFGLEALSRSARRATLVESDPEAVEIIEHNARGAKLNLHTDIFPGKTEDFLAQNQGTFDLIFLDPPFPLPRETKLSAVKNAARALTQEGILIFRYPKHEKYPTSIKIKEDTLELILQKKYGKSIVNFYGFSSRG